jgi:hypothetical protein
MRELFTYVTLAKALAAGLLSGSDNLGQSIGYPFMVDFVGRQGLGLDDATIGALRARLLV